MDCSIDYHLINVLIYIIALGGKVSMTMAVFFIIGVMFIGLVIICQS